MVNAVGEGSARIVNNIRWFIGGLKATCQSREP
jgi:hypothetical protein